LQSEEVNEAGRMDLFNLTGCQLLRQDQQKGLQSLHTLSLEALLLLFRRVRMEASLPVK